MAHPVHAEPATLVDLLDRTTDRTPDSIAITTDDGSLTYRELQTRSRAATRELLGAGVRPGALVGLVTDRSLASVVGLVAILRSGAAYVPLDPTYPPDRLSFLVADSSVEHVVGRRLDLAASAHVIDPLPPLGEYRMPAVEPDQTGVHPRGSSVAYVIYTSGSTGRPKGCPITHANVLAMLASTLPYVDCGSDAVWSVFHSLSFDFSVWELWGAWATGARATLVPPDAVADPAIWLDFCRRERVTVLSQVPSVFRFLVRAHERSSARLHVRSLVLGGETVDLSVVARWLARSRDLGIPTGTVVNMYGITEVTVHATAKVIDDAVLARAEQCRSPIGRPLAHLHLELRASDGSLVPPGAAGEMWISGNSVATGYLGRPDLTADRFVSEIAADGRELHFYRSGDLARETADGYEYLGRLDDQVQVRGYRIELGEVEKHLQDISGVVAAAAVAKPTRAGVHVLVAVLVGEPGTSVDAHQVRTLLHERLPAFMVPDVVRQIDALPLTPSGKLDRRAVLAWLG